MFKWKKKSSEFEHCNTILDNVFCLFFSYLFLFALLSHLLHVFFAVHGYVIYFKINIVSSLLCSRIFTGSTRLDGNAIGEFM